MDDGWGISYFILDGGASYDGTIGHNGRQETKKLLPDVLNTAFDCGAIDSQVDSFDTTDVQSDTCKLKLHLRTLFNVGTLDGMAVGGSS